MGHDWKAVRKLVEDADGWLLLGEQLPQWEAENIRQGTIAPLRDCDVATRNNTREPDGSRLCSIYLRKKEVNAPEDHD